VASQSLYRKHRPQRFAELVGQEHVTSALRHALLNDSVGHAYLFSGPRGTGKTTTARVFAKALNCEDLSDDGEPCGKCVNCKSFTVEGITFPDLFELDAASNNGVDNVRDLVNSVHLGLGATSRRKVYLIDEVHMLTAAASNALLKTLEEPPDHVVFMLATTDPQKVLPTVRSRTQHFDFRLLSPDELRTLVLTNLQREGIEADADAVDLIVRKAAGSGRDSLSLLDQALALGKGSLDPEQVQAMLGTTELDRLAGVLRAIAAEDPAGALVAANDAFAAGNDARRLADDLLRTLRDAFVLSAGKGRVPYDGAPADTVVLAELAEAFGLAGLTRGIEVLGETIVDIRGQTVPDPRLLLEVAVVRLARRDSRTPIETLLDRVERLEQRLERGAPAAVDAAFPAAEPAGEPAVDATTADATTADATTADRAKPALGAVRRRAPKAEPTRATRGPDATAVGGESSAMATTPETPTNETPQAQALDLDDVIVAWSRALDDLKAPVRAAVQDAQPIAVDGGTITFGVPRGPRAQMSKKRFRDEAPDVRQALTARLGATPKFKVVEHDFEAMDAFVSHGEHPGAPAPAAVDPHDEYIDPAELVDAVPADAPVDSATRLLESFPGAQIVEERPRG